VDQKIKLNAEVLSESSDVTCSWTISDPNIDLTKNALTQTTFIFTKSPAYNFINLVVKSDALDKRSLYSFFLSCMTASKKTAATSIKVHTNGPPISGLMAVDPSSGSEFQDPFTVSASRWQDDDIPLTYEFKYVSPEDASYQALKSRGEISFATGKRLPAGSETNNNILEIVGFIYDSLDSFSIYSLDVTVNKFKLSTDDLGSKLSEFNIDEQSADDVKNALAVFSSILNSVSCVHAPNCTILNRLACSATQNTCFL